VIALLVLFFAFAFRYTISDRYAFFIPFYSMVALFIGLGVHAVQRRYSGTRILYLVGGLTLLPIAVYALVPTLVQRFNVQLGTRGDVPYRNDSTYFLQPWKTGYRGAERFAAEALAGTERDAVIYADTTTVGPLLYVQEIQATRPDVKIVTGIASSEGAPAYGPEAFAELPPSRPVYVTSNKPGYGPAFILGQHETVRAGVLWKVRRSSQAN